MKLELLIFLAFCVPCFLYGNDYVLLIHGGAGNLSKEMPADLRNQYLSTLDSALSIGQVILENDGNAIDVVEKVIIYLENCPLYNAGKGAVLTFDGKIELDASIMNGADRNAGAIAGVQHVKNPITAARRVMEESPHVMLSGAGADGFAKEQNLELVDNSYFSTIARYQKWQKTIDKWNKKGTVGCVVLDSKGDLAAGTSTGGMNMKRWGRIGDSPIIGAGTYADNGSCAVSCTGHGEYFIRLSVARDVSARMKYKDQSLKQSVSEVLDELTQMGGDGGVIAVDKNGNYAFDFNTTGMFRGVVSSGGKRDVMIF